MVWPLVRLKPVQVGIERGAGGRDEDKDHLITYREDPNIQNRGEKKEKNNKLNWVIINRDQRPGRNRGGKLHRNHWETDLRFFNKNKQQPTQSEGRVFILRTPGEPSETDWHTVTGEGDWTNYPRRHRQEGRKAWDYLMSSPLFAHKANCEKQKISSNLIHRGGHLLSQKFSLFAA